MDFAVDTTDDLGFNVLHEAVLGGSADMIKHLSKGHAAPAKGAKRRKNVNGRTPMHLAAFLSGETFCTDTLYLFRPSDCSMLTYRLRHRY